MKSFVLLIALAITLIMPSGFHSFTQDNRGLEIPLDNDLVFQKKVMIYDYEGSLIREFLLEDVINHKISLTDHMVMEESNFAFDHLGDYYYLGDF